MAENNSLLATMRVVMLAFGICLMLAGEGEADGNTGAIYGRVLIAGSNEPVCPISVTVTSSSEPLQRTTTSSMGYFHFLSVTPGKVRVTVGRLRAIRALTVLANMENNELVVRPITLLRLTTLNHVTTRQYEIGRRICGKSPSYYDDYVYSDYDDH